MQGIVRTWACLNPRCKTQFDSWDKMPACPTCGCVRVDWVPRGGHIQAKAGSIDAEFKALADCFRMTDMQSGGERAMPKVRQATASAGPVMNWAPGFASPVNSGAVCVPSSAPVDFKAKVGIGKSLPPSKVFPGIRSNTSIEAMHKQ